MRKAFASIVVIAFAGLLCTSLLAFFNGSMLGDQYVSIQMQNHAYFMAY